MPEVINEPAVIKEEPTTSFADFMDDALAGVKFEEAPADGAAAAAAKAAESDAAKKEAEASSTAAKKEEPSKSDAVKIGVPDPTKVVGTQVDPNAPDPAVAAREKELDELFKSKSGEAFKSLKNDLATERKARVDEVTRLKTELESAKKAPAALPEEVERIKKDAEELRKVNEDYERELALVKVEATREYKSTVLARFEDINKQVAEIATKHKTSEAALISAIRETDTAKQDAMLTELAAPMPERDRVRLYRLAEDFQATNKQDQFVRANAKTALSMIEERRNKESSGRVEAGKQEFSKGFDAAWQAMEADFPFMKPVEGQTDWNATLKELKEQAPRVDVDRLPPSARAELVLRAATVPIMAEVVKFYAAEVVKLRAELGKNAAVRPGAGGGNPTDTKVVADDKVGFLDAFEQGMTGVR